MHYEGPIYRPPSEADSLLIQATVGCPHNKCTFCMVYKKGPPYKVRPVGDIEKDLDDAALQYGSFVKTLFFPAGNTIAMPTDQLARICRYAREKFPQLERITVYGSSRYLDEKGSGDLAELADAGLNRIHVGLESGDDEVLRRTKKGADAETQIRGCRAAIEAGLEISVYVVLGLGGTELTRQHAENTASVLNRIQPHFVRLRTFIPKVNTLMLRQVQQGDFEILSPHGVLRETETIVTGITVPTTITSDHYTNYINVSGRIPEDRHRMLKTIKKAFGRPESDFRSVFVGTQ